MNTQNYIKTKQNMIFIGTDGSLGFKKNATYTITIFKYSNGYLRIETESLLGKKLICKYSSVTNFLQNWGHKTIDEGEYFTFGGEIEFPSIDGDLPERITYKGYKRNNDGTITLLLADRKKEIDIEEIRESLGCDSRGWFYMGDDFSTQERLWFSAYRVVSEVIRQLNGDWTANWNDSLVAKSSIFYNHEWPRIATTDWEKYQHSILPYCKDRETAQKVIDLCTPELITLFNIK